MRPADAEQTLAELNLDAEARRACAPRYDEVLLTATSCTETLVTVVFRTIKHGELRVIQLAGDGARWSVLSANSVPITHREQPARVPLAYPERTFHFVPGTGERPDWVDAERPSRADT